MNRSFSFMGLLAAALLTSGCGYVGEPLPPLANVPARVTDVTAVQRGGRLVVQFTIPQKTTEGRPIGKDATVDLRVGPGGEPFDQGTWAGRAKRAQPGAVEEGRAHYEVPVDEWAGQEVVLAVRVIGGNHKDSGWSSYLIVPIVKAPGQPQKLQVTAIPEGVRVTWQAAGARFRVYKKQGDGIWEIAANPDKPEWVDTAVEFGKPYSYLVQTVAKAGDREAESEPSAPFPVTPADTFPPAAPAGLRAVMAATTIELAWDQNTESDLAGYRVYRAAAGQDFRKIGESTGAPSFSDHDVERGKVYRYAVSAFDKSGNESARSTVVEASLQ